jgi:hypothetical protein
MQIENLIADCNTDAALARPAARERSVRKILNREVGARIVGACDPAFGR